VNHSNQGPAEHRERPTHKQPTDSQANREHREQPIEQATHPSTDRPANHTDNSMTQRSQAVFQASTSRPLSHGMPQKDFEPSQASMHEGGVGDRARSLVELQVLARQVFDSGVVPPDQEPEFAR